MRLKLYHGLRMAEAMAAVRAELGPEALILSSRKIAGGFEVTAASPRAAAEATQTQVAKAGQSDRGLALRSHGVPASLIAPLLDGALADSLARLVSFAAIPLSATGRPVAFIGPAGAGKTLSLVRLAARCVLAGTRPMVVSTDCLKAGANAQLAALLDVLGLDLTLSQPQDLQRCLARATKAGPVLIDTAGSNPFDANETRLLSGMLGPNLLHGAVVMPAGLAPDEAQDLAAAYRGLGATFLVVTRMDVARRYGAVVAAAREGLTLTEAGVSSSVVDGMVNLTPALLAQRLMAIPEGRRTDDRS